MKVNGKEIVLCTTLTLMQFLIDNKYDISKIAVEIDGNIISKNDYETTILHEDAVIEVVSFVGGG